jgi:hypothetical protein
VQCAWHQDIIRGKRSYFFDPASTHGICFQCAVKQLTTRPNALLRFAKKYQEELFSLGIPLIIIVLPSGEYIEGVGLDFLLLFLTE